MLDGREHMAWKRRDADLGVELADHNARRRPIRGGHPARRGLDLDNTANFTEAASRAEEPLCLGSLALPQFLVEQEQEIATTADAAEGIDDVTHGLLLFDLLGGEPVEPRLRGVVLLVDDQSVKVRDRARDRALVLERFLEDLEWRRILLARLREGPQSHATLTIRDEGVETHRVLNLFAGLMTEPGRAAGQALLLAVSRHREVGIGGLELDGELIVHRRLDLLRQHGSSDPQSLPSPAGETQGRSLDRRERVDDT